jgi:hypothetical protein
MKDIMMYAIAYTIKALIVAAAFLSPDGMGIVIQGMEWASAASAIIDNFVPVFAIISVVVTIIVAIVIVLNDEYFDEQATAAIKKKGVDNALKAYTTKPFKVFMQVVFWGILIAAGWIASALCFIVATTIFAVNTIGVRKAIERMMPEELVDNILEG